MEIRTIGIDLGKTVFHLVGVNARGELVVRRKYSRTQLLRFTSNLRECLIGMEACGGSHFLGRALREQGHDVRLMPAQYVKPYVKTNKNDYIDAEAIAEACLREPPRIPIAPMARLPTNKARRNLLLASSSKWPRWRKVLRTSSSGMHVGPALSTRASLASHNDALLNSKTFTMRCTSCDPIVSERSSKSTSRLIRYSFSACSRCWADSNACRLRRSANWLTRSTTASKPIRATQSCGSAM